MEIEDYILHCQQRVNSCLKKQLPPTTKEPQQLHKAMRYTVLNGGKRIRSAFVYATGEALNANSRALDICSAAIELIHAFSLIQDDLPALDNSATRHGKQACHKAFDEATALLASDALLVLAYEILAGLDKYLTPTNNLKMMKMLSHYLGSLGMAGGEASEIALKNTKPSLKKLSQIYMRKTGYLIWSSILLATFCSDQHPSVKDLQKFGLYIGLAFQIHDDIVDIEVPTKISGKPRYSDRRNRKVTYPQLIGLQKAKEKKKYFFKRAMHYLMRSGINNEKLLALGEFVIQRQF